MIRFDRLYRHLLIAFAVGIFFTSVANYTERYGLVPLYWIFAFAMVSAPLVLAKLATGHVRIPPVMFWGVGYVIVSILWFYASPEDDIAFDAVQKRILSVIFIGLVLVVVSGREEQILAQRWIAAAVVLAAALNFYELFNPLTFSPIPGRSQGLYPNVNQSGAAIVLGLILSYHVVPDRLKLAFVGVTALGIIPTFSRSAMIGWFLVVAFFFLRGGVVAQVRRLIVLSVVVVAVVWSPLWTDLQQSLEQRGVLNLNVIERIAFFTGGTTTAESTSERKAVAEAAWTLFGERPLTGWGTDSSNRIEGFDVGTHNIYLAMMVDHGVAGLFVMPLLLICVMWGANRKVFDLVFPWLTFMILWGMFSHNILDERYILLSTALTASIITSRRTVPLPEPDVIPSDCTLLAPVATR